MACFPFFPGADRSKSKHEKGRKPMHHPPLETIVERLLAHARCEQDELCLPILHQVTQGKPLTKTMLSASLRMSQNELEQHLAQAADMEFDQQGTLVGWGVTMIPTRHGFQMNGKSLFTWCAFDTVLFPPALGETAQIQSTCPVTGQPMTFVATPGGAVLDLTPSSAVLSLILPAERDECVRATFCEQSLLFWSQQAAISWLPAHPGALLLSIEEAALVGRVVATTRFKEKEKESVERTRLLRPSPFVQ
jgi:alkylmercury lyase